MDLRELKSDGLTRSELKGGAMAPAVEPSTLKALEALEGNSVEPYTLPRPLSAA